MNPSLRHLAVPAALIALGATLAVGGCQATTSPSPPAEPSVRVAAPPPVTVPDGRPVGAPVHLRIPAIGVAEALRPVGLLPDGAMQTPSFGEAGWYRLGPRPGAPGPAVLVAHVHGPDGDDVFARLLTFPNVLITAHQAFFTREAVRAIAETTIRNLTDFERGTVRAENRVTAAMIAG